MAGEGPEIGHAHVGVSADNDELRRELAATEADVRGAFERMDKVRAKPEIEAETREVNRKIAETRALLLAVDGMDVEAELGLDKSEFDRQVFAAKKELAALQQRKLELSVETREYRDAERDIKAVNRTLSDNQIQNRKSAAAVAKHSVEVAKLREQYGRLQRQARLIEAQRSMFQPDKLREQELRLSTLRAEMDRVSSRARALGSTVDDIDVDVDHHTRTLGNWARSIANIRIHMGIMSLTITQFFRAVTLLGPILEGLAGSTIALAGSLGAGILGAAGVGAAGLTAFGITAFGLVQAVQPAFEELGNLQAGFEAAREAAIKYGKGSSEFETAQKNLNKLIQNSSPEVVRLARATNALGAQWQKLTGPAQRDFFGLAAEGIRGLQSMLPMLSRNLNQTMATARQGAERWIDTFSGPEAQAKINNLLTNFRTSLPSVMRGFEHLGVAFLNTISEISNHFDSLGRGFESWAKNIRQITEGAGFGETVDGWISSMREWGHLLQATGRLLGTFFGQGREAGEGLLRTLTETFNRWSDWMGTAEGRNSLAEFFQRSSDMARQFFSTLGPVLEILFELAQITAPITEGILAVVRGVANLVTAFTDLEGAKELLSAIGVGLASAFVVGRVLAFAGAIRSVAAAFGLLRGAAVAGTASQLAMFGTSAAAAGTAAGGLRGALGGLLARINPIAAGITAAVGGYVLLEGVQKDWEARNEETRKELGMTRREFALARAGSTDYEDALHQQAASQREAQRSVDDIVPAYQRLKESARNAADAEKAYQQAVKQHGRNSDQAWDALYRLRSARQRDAQVAEQAARRITNAQDDQNQALRDAKLGYIAAVEAAEEARDAAASYFRDRDLIDTASEADMLADELDEVAAAENRLRDAQANRTASTINIARVMKGLPEVTGKAATAMGHFARQFGRVPAAKRLLIQTNSAQAIGDLSRVARQANQLTGRKRVVDILANSGSAQEAIGRLQNLIQRVTNRRYVARIEQSGAPEVVGWLQKVLGFKLPRKVQEIAESGTFSVLKILSNIFGFDLPTKVQRIVESGGGAVLGVLSNIKDTFLPPITQVINQVVRKSNFKGGYIGGFAKGADERLMDKAGKEAARRRPREADMGGIYSHPTYLVGEENKREYVIATNSSYREANERYLAQAADEFGFILMKASAGFAKGGKRGKGPLFGPRSEYEDLRHQINLSESTFSNMQRHYEEQLNLGVRYPIPSLSDLAGQKQGSIDWVDKLIEHIQGNVIRRLGNQKDTLSKKIRRLERQTRGRPPKGDRGRRKWDQKKQELQKLKNQRSEAADRIPEMRRELDDLRQERYGYELDLASLLRGDTAPGGGGGGPTLEEQFATFNQQRLDLFRTFGGNFNPIGAAFGAGAGGVVPTGFGGSGAAPTAMEAPASTATVAPVASTTSTKTVNQYISMEQPQDPHLFTQALEWEANAGD